MVTHGGHGTVIKALAHGVPVFGVRRKRTAGAPAIGGGVKQVLASPDHTEAARRMAQTIGDEVGEEAARHELQALASPCAGPSKSGSRAGTLSAEG